MKSNSIIEFWPSKAEKELDLKSNTLLPSDVVPSGNIKILSPEDKNLRIILFWIILSDFFLFIKIVLASLDKKPKIGQDSTSDLATNLIGKSSYKCNNCPAKFDEKDYLKI